MWQSFCNYNIVCQHQSTEPEGIPGFSLDKNNALLHAFILLKKETCH